MSDSPLHHKPAVNKSQLFDVMGLGPVWVLKNAPASTTPLGPTQHAALPSSLLDLKAMVSTCKLCPLAQTRERTVFGQGVEQADLMVIGEAPGHEEEQEGLPFIGNHGQLLDRMLATIQCSRITNTYVSNVLKCRPTESRDIDNEVIQACLPYLHQQIQTTQAKVLVLIGKAAIKALLGLEKPVGELRGIVHEVQIADKTLKAIVTYHPAYLARRPSEKAKAWDDLILIKKVLG